MVMPQARAVHAEPSNEARRPRFPAGPATTQSWGMSCAQTAIIPTKSVIDASAAASSTNVFNISASRFWNIRRTLFRFCSKESSAGRGSVLRTRALVNWGIDMPDCIIPEDELTGTRRLGLG
jgi:hypothetical protein